MNSRNVLESHPKVKNGRTKRWELVLREGLRVHSPVLLLSSRCIDWLPKRREGSSRRNELRPFCLKYRNPFSNSIPVQCSMPLISVFFLWISACPSSPSSCRLINWLHRQRAALGTIAKEGKETKDDTHRRRRRKSTRRRKKTSSCRCRIYFRTHQ